LHTVCWRSRWAQSVGSSGTFDDRPDEIGFLLAVGLAVCAENFVKPDSWFTIRIGMLPGIPR